MTELMVLLLPVRRLRVVFIPHIASLAVPMLDEGFQLPLPRQTRGLWYHWCANPPAARACTYTIRWVAHAMEGETMMD
eukprot:scaffold2846_cov322-Pavlova_lutheri.AAC.41